MDLDNIKKQALVVDIETSAEFPNGNEVNINAQFEDYLALAKCKWIGFYSYKHDKEYYLEVSKDRDLIVKLLAEHSIVVGFNSIEFDYPIIVNNGLASAESKVLHVDCMQVLGAATFKDKKGYGYKGRGSLMGYKFKRNSLQCMAETMELDFQKSDIDYKIFKKDEYTEEEKKLIKFYLRNDVMATKGMFDKLWDFWKPFTKLIDFKSVVDLSWIRSSIASLTYKSACHEMGVEPTYGEIGGGGKEEMGGRVIEPKYEEVRKVWYVDFGCLLKGEQVHTYNGYRNVEDIKVYKNRHWCYNDKSISQDNDFNNFVDKRKKNVNQIVEIYLEDGSVIKQTTDHRVLTDKGVKHAGDINSEDKLIAPTHTPVKDGDYDDMFELLGIFICEGSLYQNKRFLTDKRHPKGRNSTASQTNLCIKNHETDFKNQIEGLLNKHVPFDLNFKTRKKASLGREYTHLNIYNTRKEVHNWFFDFVNKNYNLEEITKDTGRIKGFLTGVLRSDACWNVERKSVILPTTDSVRISIIKKCFQCLGIHVNINKDKKKYGERNEAYRLEIYYRNHLDKLFSWFTWGSYRDKKISDYSHKRDFVNKNTHQNILNVKVIDGSFEVYDLTMHRQESPYFVHNGIFTHNSLYPHIICMFNLFSEVDESYSGKVWHGNDVFQVRGHYNVSQQHPLAKAVQNRLKERIELKRIDPDNPKAYALKIWLNSLYGASRSPIFEKIHTPNCGWDCSWLGQQIQEFSQRILEKSGFEVVAGDTDSLFFVAEEERLDDVDYVKACLRGIVKKLMENAPFPSETFNVNIEHYIDYILFAFADQPVVDAETGKNLKKGNRLVKERKGLKKNYLFLYDDDDGETKIKLMGLPIIKDNATPLGIKIYEEVLKPLILNKKSAKFTQEFIDKTITEYLKNKEIMELLAVEYKVNPFHTYKKESQIQAQISKGYFNGDSGVAYLIKNKKVGKAGKGNKYCSITEALEANLSVKDLDLEKTYNELNVFIEAQS